MYERTTGNAHDGALPDELLDLGHPTWRDRGAFAAWCRRQEVDEPTADGWFARFTAARDLWSHRHGFTVAAGSFGQRHVDHARLRDAGVPWAGSTTRHLAHQEALAVDPVAFRQSCRLMPYGDTADPYPAWLPRSRDETPSR